MKIRYIKSQANKDFGAKVDALTFWARVALILMIAGMVVAVILSLRIGDQDAISFKESNFYAIFFVDFCVFIYALLSSFLMIRTTYLLCNYDGDKDSIKLIVRVWMVPFISIIIFLCFGADRLKDLRKF